MLLRHTIFVLREGLRRISQFDEVSQPLLLDWTLAASQKCARVHMVSRQFLRNNPRSYPFQSNHSLYFSILLSCFPRPSFRHHRRHLFVESPPPFWLSTASTGRPGARLLRRLLCQFIERLVADELREVVCKIRRDGTLGRLRHRQERLKYGVLDLLLVRTPILDASIVSSTASLMTWATLSPKVRFFMCSASSPLALVRACHALYVEMKSIKNDAPPQAEGSLSQA